ncbi:SRPBCC family protein [Sinisalibacter aestuarii]|uniref:DNA polymerase III subunit gamma/tau n=1 Tax=Sinisalibacter aestuarii TaxID=2949426 RepID=A0ABQ5LQ65_9RHOB|nr:SRPBCC family protein [Sinisalibacter aestuarii]GKY86197.1 DNA polymerase III subunit gamma/tau [Sinisalibacter aestuarii]
MKMATREDIAAPIEAVFEQISDFDGFERAAMRRGAEVVRTDTLSAPGPGMSWRAGFDYRGKARKANIELSDYEVPERVRARVQSTGIEMEVVVELVAMSRSRTRMNLTLDARPRTIPARLMIQSLKLARQSVLKRFRRRVADYAADLEERLRDRG